MIVRSMLILLAALAAQAATAADDATRIQVVYGPSAVHAGMVGRMRSARVLENIAGYLERFAHSRKLVMQLRDCGQSNAMFYPRANQIVLCTELVAHMRDQQRDHPDQPARGLLVGGALFWVAAHEFGHALVHGRRWPVLGREEDAADQIATLVVLQGRLSGPALSGAIGFFDRDAGAQSMGDVHSLDPQRRINIACWAWGADPRAYANLARIVPAQRRPSCRGEYLQMRDSVAVLLRKQRR